MYQTYKLHRPDGTIARYILITDALIVSGYCTSNDEAIFEKARQRVARAIKKCGRCDLGNGYCLRADAPIGPLASGIAVSG